MHKIIFWGLVGFMSSTLLHAEASKKTVCKFDQSKQIVPCQITQSKTADGTLLKLVAANQRTYFVEDLCNDIGECSPAIGLSKEKMFDGIDELSKGFRCIAESSEKLKVCYRK